MKIAVIHIITLLELGGAQQNTLYTVEHLDRNRFAPFLICGKGGLLDQDAKGLEDIPVFFVSSLLREVRPDKDVSALWQIRWRIRRILNSRNFQTPVIVHTHSSKAGILGRWAARLEGVPIIVHTFHGFGFHVGQRPWVRRFFQTLERVTGRITHRFIMVSRANMEVAHGLGIADRDRMVLIRSGISIREYQYVPESRGEIRKTLGIAAHQKVVLNVSCLKPQKAPEDFVEVAAKVASRETDAVFLLVGDGILRPEVESAALRHGLGDRFRLLGWRRDVPQLLKAADVLVLTSRWEGLPRVLPQAMAAGTPAVATAVDGSPEAIEDGINGFLVQPGDVEGMAERILRLLGDPLLRDRMGKEGQKRVGEFDIDLMVRQQEKLYEELVKEWALSKGGAE